MDESKKLDDCADSMNATINSALRLVQVARGDYMRHADAAHIHVLLQNAEAAVLHVEQLIGAGPRREALLARLEAKFNVTPAILNNFHAHIAYHRAAVYLRSQADEAAVARAVEHLARPLAQRELACTAATSAAANERQCVHIKLGDVYSRQGKPSAAVNEYNMHRSIAPSPAVGALSYASDSASIFQTFWEVRAANNAAIVEFGLGNDTEALELMQLVAGSTRAWLHRHAHNHGVDLHALALLTSEAVAHSARLAEGKLSDALLRLVNMGADDAVDILHLPPARVGAAAAGADRAAGAPKLLLPEDTADAAGRDVAVEYLERVKLMLRKFRTSRANCLLIACAPGCIAPLL